MEERERYMTDKELLRRLSFYAKPYWKQFLLVFLIMLVSIFYELASPWFVGYIERMIKEDFPLKALFQTLVIYVGILLISVLCTYLQTILLQKIGQKILSKIRRDLFSHIESLSHHQLTCNPVGKLVTRVANDTNAISMMFTNVLSNLLKNTMIIVGVVIAMLSLNFSLALMVLAFSPLIIGLTIVFRYFTRKAYRKVTDSRTQLNTFLSENLSGIKITQIFNREEQKMKEFLTQSKGYAEAKKQQLLVFSIFRPSVYMLYISTVLALFYFGAKGYLEGVTLFGQVIESGVMVSFYMYITKFYNPIQMLAEQFDILQRSFASAEKIFSIMDQEPEIVDDADAMEIQTLKGNIEFKDVWFCYKPGEWILKGVSFQVKAGQTVAFVGATGSGKTTILSLLCRNYDIQKGQILVDGIDIRKIKISSLRRHFGQMLQDVFLFSGNIRSNILLQKEGITDEEIMKVCRYVNADHFINKLEKGLEEEVKERGSNFSVGQRQLLSFARTIIHNPSVMILDEATANIDTETELLIQDSLEKMRNIGTMLVVAHRLSTIRHADKIILLSKGKILEEGNHQQLLSLKGKYYQLYSLQEQF